MRAQKPSVHRRPLRGAPVGSEREHPPHVRWTLRFHMGDGRTRGCTVHFIRREPHTRVGTRRAKFSHTPSKALSGTPCFATLKMEKRRELCATGCWTLLDVSLASCIECQSWWLPALSVSPSARALSAQHLAAPLRPLCLSCVGGSLCAAGSRGPDRYLLGCRGA